MQATQAIPATQASPATPATSRQNDFKELVGTSLIWMDYNITYKLAANSEFVDCDVQLKYTFVQLYDMLHPHLRACIRKQHFEMMDSMVGLFQHYMPLRNIRVTLRDKKFITGMKNGSIVDVNAFKTWLDGYIVRFSPYWREFLLSIAGFVAGEIHRRETV